MSKSRFLIYFSYIGTNFSGVAKQLNTKLTVHNVIEEQLKSLNRLCELKSPIWVSSRTDAGVHALSNTAHFDLSFVNVDYQSLDSSCKLLKNSLNELFMKNDHFIRILDIKRVRDDFVSRHAKSRTYVYRLALLKNGKQYWTEFERINRVEQCLSKLKPNRDDIPIIRDFRFPFKHFLTPIEKDFITELNEPFDEELFKKALGMFNGTFDFSAFTTQTGRKEMLKDRKNPMKTVQITWRFDCARFLSEHIGDEPCRFVEVEIKAESFLYKMIRKIVGAAYDVSQSRIPLEQIARMLTTPEKFYTENLTTVLKPQGLYLKNVEYEEII